MYRNAHKKSGSLKILIVLLCNVYISQTDIRFLCETPSQCHTQRKLDYSESMTHIHANDAHTNRWKIAFRFE